MISKDIFQKSDWEYFYPNSCESIHLDMPITRGNYVSTHCFIDANHAGDKTARISMPRILIFCNRAPIIWHSKRKNGVETSMFGSEFTAMKKSVELIAALRYKLRMFGVPINGSTEIVCGTEAVYKNSSTPKSQLRRKHHSILYHTIREAVASGAYSMAKKYTDTELSNIFTKVLPQPRRELLLESFTY